MRTTRQNHQLFPAIFILGVFLMICGLGCAYIEKRFTAAALILSLTGILFIAVSIVYFGFIFSRSFSFSNIIVYGFQFLRFLVLVAVIMAVNYLAIRYNARFDLTKNRQHTLDVLSKNIVQDLKSHIKITVFYVGIAPKYIEDLLGEYNKLSSGKIETEIIDPLVQIGYAAQFGNVIRGDEKKAVVQSSQERSEIDFTDNPLSEEMLTNTILKVTRQKRNIYFLAGHDEFNISDTSTNGYSIFKKLLEDSNCAVNELLLGNQRTIPPDCDVLVAAGPKKPLSREEEDTIQNYLEKGGKALLLIESAPLEESQPSPPDKEQLTDLSLNSLLNRWGLKIGNDVVVDLENYAGADVGCPVTKNYPPHKQIVNNLGYTFYIRPRSISLIENLPKTVKAAPLVLTASKENSWAETNKSLKIKFDALEDTKGPVVLAAVIWEPKNEQKISDTKIIVFADADFLTNAFVQQYSNAAIASNSVSWLTDLENIVKIENKDIAVPRLDLTSKQKRSIIVVLLAMPLLIAGWGILVWLK